jgi:hypothetical protein
LAKWTDVDLEGADYWNANFSSALATWLACWMGCEPVLLAGMDLYQGKQKYFYEYPNLILTASHVASAGVQMRAWRQAWEKCLRPEVIRAMSGPLMEVFGGY